MCPPGYYLNGFVATHAVVYSFYTFRFIVSP